MYIEAGPGIGNGMKGILEVVVVHLYRVVVGVEGDVCRFSVVRGSGFDHRIEGIVEVLIDILGILGGEEVEIQGIRGRTVTPKNCLF